MGITIKLLRRFKLDDDEFSLAAAFRQFS